MFTTNLLKKPKLDAKRKKAIAYFNNKFPNSSIVEKSGFWTLNRVKILLSAAVALLAGWVVAFEFSGKMLLALLGCTYIIAPFICFRLNKSPATIKIKKIRFLKVASRVYRQSELPSAMGFSSIFTGGIVGIIIVNFIDDLIGRSTDKEYVVVMTLLLPFLMYHLLCFIGNHPLAIFSSIGYQTNRSHAGYKNYSAPHYSSYESSPSTSTFSDDDGIPGAPWISSYSSPGGWGRCVGSDIDNR